MIRLARRGDERFPRTCRLVEGLDGRYPWISDKTDGRPMDAIITHTVSGQWKMGTVSEQISAGIAGKTVAARCLSPFSTVLGIHRPKKGTGTVGKPETAAKTRL